MSKTIAVIQSNYIPWKGYFDIINMSDEFILFDEAQYTRRDWRNRNKIKTPQGTQWLTIPVKVKGKYHQLINETEINDTHWITEHLKTIRHFYARAACFKDVFPFLEDLYQQAAQETLLSHVNYIFLRGICDYLGIQTPLVWSTDYVLVEGKTDRLLNVCHQAGAAEYISGPSAKGYMDEALFETGKVKITYMDYSGYPEYPQLYPPFDHAVSIVDMLLNLGKDTPQYMKSFQAGK